MNEVEKNNFFARQFKAKWLTQGLNGVPLYLSTVAESGHRFKKYLGFNYSPFLFYYRDNYAEGSYRAADFVRLWMIIRSRIKRDTRYLAKIRGKYDAIFGRHLSWLIEIRKAKMTDQTDDWLLKNLERAGYALIDSMNLSHAIEIISIGLEEDLKEALATRHQETKLNSLLAALTDIYKPSFINQEEQDLIRIKSALPGKREGLLTRHQDKYYWFNTNYTGSRPADRQFFLKRLSGLRKKRNKVESSRKGNFRLPKDPKVNRLIRLIRLTADWQDERKVNIFKAIYHTEILIKEFSRRTGINVTDLHYLAIKEILNFSNINNYPALKKRLAIRRRGCFQYMGVGREIIVSGLSFKRLEKKYHALRTRMDSVPLSIEGTTANSGRVVGSVAICKSIKDLSKVKKGDVLVTSMTRPEYLAGIKRAAALITDEGGITCHAAIVSRELGLPCIIGTRVATRALKDGDLVEVNANHGVVKILNQLKA